MQPQVLLGVSRLMGVLLTGSWGSWIGITTCFSSGEFGDDALSLPFLSSAKREWCGFVAGTPPQSRGTHRVLHKA